jgi:hypothetical protein
MLSAFRGGCALAAKQASPHCFPRPTSLQTRWLSALVTRPLTLEQAFTSTHMILSQLESPASLQMLHAARTVSDVAEKWQRVNTVLIHSTLQVVGQLGFAMDPQGFQKYTEAFAEVIREEREAGQQLQQLVRQKWDVLLKHGYGCGPAPPLSLGQARTIAIDLVDALQVTPNRSH